ncbi:MAG: bifunctional adenosylcobinamide kinase/adenosylcobinamide-phosphate guanylyltransferase [Deltaproteobacteria bacterium]
MNTKRQGSGVREGTVPDLRTECNEVVESGPSPAKLIFITGGARSGKSAFALKMANSITPPQSPPWQGGDERGGRKCYLATAQALDSEMGERIAKHKAERGNDWECIEEPLQVAEKIEEVKDRYDVIMFDCLTLWVSNLMHARSIPPPLEGEACPESRSFLRQAQDERHRRGQGLEEVLAPGGCEGGLREEFASLICTCKGSGSTVIVVSNEVGLGIVPDNQLAREFRDIAGTANQLFAKAADEAYFVVSGIPMRLK